MSSQIQTADDLVDFVLAFTGSTNTTEIIQCIFLMEHSIRNIRLPCNRSDPYDPQYWARTDQQGSIEIPSDLVEPILFFHQGSPDSNPNMPSETGPWMVFDRVGDRDIITDTLIANLYWKPVNIPQVIRGKFSEVAGRYKFLPLQELGSIIQLYYYKTWPYLYSVDATGGVVQTNGPFQSAQELYVYGTLREYYLKRHMAEDAQLWDGRFQAARANVSDQFERGRWTGGHTRMRSIWQPRTSKQYQIK